MNNIYLLSKNQTKILSIALLSSILVFGLIPLLNIGNNTSWMDDSPFTPRTTITINSPTATTYYSGMAGYYPATFGFENDAATSNPEGWTSYEYTGTSVQVIAGDEWHYKQLELADSSSTNVAVAVQSFANRAGGTVELWVKSTNTWTCPTTMVLQGTGNSLVQVTLTANRLYYWDGATQIQTSYVVSSNVWYRISIDFATYYIPGPSPPHAHWIAFTVRVNDVQVVADSYDTTDPNQYINCFWVGTGDTSTGYTSYFDAIGYSWDNDYDTGDNEHLGLLLDIAEDSATGVEYQIDSGPIYSILGDTVLRMPYSGEHTLQVDATGYDPGTVTFTIA